MTCVKDCVKTCVTNVLTSVSKHVLRYVLKQVLKCVGYVLNIVSDVKHVRFKCDQNRPCILQKHTGLHTYNVQCWNKPVTWGTLC